jgi:predicted metalloprotease with PDZ domain
LQTFYFFVKEFKEFLEFDFFGFLNVIITKQNINITNFIKLQIQTPFQMKYLFLIFFLPSIIFGQVKVQYQVFYTENMANEGIKIHVHFQNNKATDSTYFHFSNQVWGQDSLLNCFKTLQNENPNYTFKLIPDSNRIVAYHPKSREIAFYYRIKQDYVGEPLEKINRPRIRADHFHILGESMFTVPEEVFESKIENHQINVTIDWIDFPEKYVIHNTFDSQKKHQNLSKIKLWGEFYHSVFVGGDYRIHQFNCANKPVYFAIRGDWFVDYQDKKLLGALEKTIQSQRTFWNDNSANYFTVIMTPTLSTADSSFSGQSTTGSGVWNAFDILSTNNPFNNWNVINYIFNHELMHSWIGGKIGMKHEELNYWFSEGFTDYYTYKNRLRSKDLDFKTWLEDFNMEVLQAHWKNPERNKANFLIKDDFWKSRDVEKIPYRRGAIFAFWLDNQILVKSNYTKSLDDLMKELLQICETEQKKFDDELFLDLVQQYLQKDISYFFQKHILDGQDILFEKSDLIEGFTFEVENNLPKLNANKNVEKIYLSIF